MKDIFNYPIPQSEQDARIFAIHLLIPKEQLIKFIKKGGQTVSTCAEYFQVPSARIRDALRLYNITE